MLVVAIVINIRNLNIVDDHFISSSMACSIFRVFFLLLFYDKALREYLMAYENKDKDLKPRYYRCGCGIYCIHMSSLPDWLKEKRGEFL